MPPGEQAKSAVREQIRDALTYLLSPPGAGAAMFAHHQLFRFEPGTWSYDDEARQAFIERARAGSGAADAALREHAVHFLRSGRVLPGDLALYIADALEGKVKLKVGDRPGVLRQCVAEAVETILALGLGFNKTRNDATDPRKASACSLIAEVFEELGHPEYHEARLQDALKPPRKGRARKGRARGGG